MNEEKRAHVRDMVEAHLDGDPIQWWLTSGNWQDEDGIDFTALVSEPERYRRKPESVTHTITRWETKNLGCSVYRTSDDPMMGDLWIEKETFTHTVGGTDDS